MNANKKIIEALDILENERGIKREVVIDGLKEALEKAYKKQYLCAEATVRVDIDPRTFKVSITEIRTVVDDVNDEDLELSLEEAQAINPKYQLGDLVETKVSPDDVNRLVASGTKQMLRQKIREAEKEALYNEYADKEGEIITGIVDRVEPRFAIINIGKTGAFLPINQQIPGERLVDGQSIKVYVTEVSDGSKNRERDGEKTKNKNKGMHVNVSRTDPKLVTRLFEMEVPEIYEGTVEIKSVSREAGERTKIAVYSKDPDVDPSGACIGPKGTRVHNIVKELNGEMIDIVEYSSDPKVFIANALKPTDVLNVLIDEEKHSAIVVVRDNQLSLAIGKKGQNARLAVRLTNWKIDIKSMTDAINEGIDLMEPTEESLQLEDFVPSVIDEVSEEEEDAIETPSLDASEEVEEVIEPEEEVEEQPQTMPIYTEDEDYDYEYDDDDISKYDEEIDYDEYDEYYDNH